MGVAIIGVPDKKATNLTLRRSGNTMDFKWAIPSSLIGDDNPYRLSNIDTIWVFQASKNMATAYQEVREAATTVTADRIWVRDGSPSLRSTSNDYDRSKYHPLTLDRYLQSVTATVSLRNKDAYGHHPLESPVNSSVTYNFELPDAPKIDDLTIEQSTGKVSGIIHAASEEGAKEMYDTMYTVTRQDNFTSAYRNETTVVAWTSSRESSIDAHTDSTPEAASLTDDQWIRIRIKAYSRGVRGNSPTVTKEYVISRASRPTITGIDVTTRNGYAAGSNPSGAVIVRFRTNATATKPIDTVQLQILKNTAISTVEMANLSSDWVDVSGALDDGTCVGLTDTVANALPGRYNHVWYRVMATRSGLVSYSDPVKVPALERNSTPVSGQTVVIDSVEVRDDGASLKVIFGWSGDDSNGTEISWSDKADAWDSTEEPTVYNVSDLKKDATSQVSGKDYSASLVIRGLQEGMAYYIKARRYMDDGTNVEYADEYATAPEASYPAIPTTKPSSVTLKADTFVQRGSDLEVSWTYAGVSDQKQWNLYKVEELLGGTKKVVLASGSDSKGVAVISADQLASLGDSITLSVSITTGGDWTDSPNVSVKIADPPTLIAVTDAELLSQPMQFYAGTNCSNATMVAKVYSKGTFSETPDSTIVQTDGDTVWSGKLTPDWYDNEGTYYTIVTLPEGLPFFNGISYVLDVVVIDPETGFSSPLRQTTFEVAWAHTSRMPASTTKIIPMTDSKWARISPQPPENWAFGDVYDLYRVTNDSVDLIAEGQAYGTDALDRFAPFGKNVSLRYRIVNRTKDGDIEWRDFPYSLKGYQLAFDWGNGQHVELPYNIVMSDEYAKNYEAHTHLDGSKSGHWNPGFNKKGSFTTKLDKFDSEEQETLVRSMGKYAGPVFVRTPNGGAYQANVTVKNIRRSFDDLLLGVEISVEALSLTDEFRLAPDDFISVDAQPQPEEPTYERSQILAWDNVVPEPNDTFTLNEQATGEYFKVELSTSYDNYLEPWSVSATYFGRTVTLGAFDEGLTEYLQRASQVASTQYLLKAYYNISMAADEDTAEETSEETE